VKFITRRRDSSVRITLRTSGHEIYHHNVALLMTRLHDVSHSSNLEVRRDNSRNVNIWCGYVNYTILCFSGLSQSTLTIFLTSEIWYLSRALISDILHPRIFIRINVTDNKADVSVHEIFCLPQAFVCGVLFRNLISFFYFISRNNSLFVYSKRQWDKRRLAF